MSKLCDEDLEHYRRHGFLVVRDAVPEELRRELYLAFAQVFAKYSPEVPSRLEERGWDDPEFNAAIIRFRSRAPEAFAVMYDTIQTSVGLARFACEPRLAGLAATLVAESPRDLSATDLLLRMDVPADRRNRLEWHQDSAYFRQNAKGDNGTVCWMPMRDRSRCCPAATGSVGWRSPRGNPAPSPRSSFASRRRRSPPSRRRS